MVLAMTTVVVVVVVDTSWLTHTPLDWSPPRYKRTNKRKKKRYSLLPGYVRPKRTSTGYVPSTRYYGLVGRVQLFLATYTFTHGTITFLCVLDFGRKGWCDVLHLNVYRKQNLSASVNYYCCCVTMFFWQVLRIFHLYELWAGPKKCSPGTYDVEQ